MRLASCGSTFKRVPGRHPIVLRGARLAASTPTAQTRSIKMRRPRNWFAIIDRLNRSARGEVRIRMGSPGSAQVTRCRLLAEWSNLEATTTGSMLRLRLKRSA